MPPALGEANEPHYERTPLLSTTAAKPTLLKGEAYTGDAEYSRVAAFTVFFFPALGGLLFGYDIGGTSAVLAQLESSNFSGVSWSEKVKDSSILQGLITSNGVLGAMLGSLICFRIGDIIGRKAELIIASFLFLLGALVESTSGRENFNAEVGITVLLLGRVTYGVGCGFAMHGAPAYIGEMAPSAIRGVLVSLKEAMIVVGMLMGYFMGWCLSASVGGWRSVYAGAMIPAFLMFGGMYTMPQSARWLVLRGRIADARRSLRYVSPRCDELAIAEIQAAAQKVISSSSSSRGPAEGGVLAGLTTPQCRGALVAGVGLVLLQQFTGQPSVLYYADSIFQDVGLGNLAAVLVAAFKLLATLLAVFTVDKHGRTKLLQLGCSLMLVALCILGAAFLFPYVSEEDCNDEITEDTCADASKCSWTAGCECFSVDSSCSCCGVAGLDAQKLCIMAAMFLYIGGYQVGFGPVSWLIISEVFPLEVRGKAISVAVVSNFASNLLVTFFFPVMMDLIGISTTFFLFAALDIYAMVFIRRRVPETKGLSLEKIEQLFLRMHRDGGRVPQHPTEVAHDPPTWEQAQTTTKKGENSG